MTTPDIQELMAIDPILGATRSELESLQLERLKWTLHHAYSGNTSYRRAFDTAGMHPDGLRSLADLANFPFTTKADLRNAYPFSFFCVPMDRIARIHASSGTTGKPTVVGYTRSDLATWGGLVARSIRAAGGRPGMKVHIAYGYGLFTGGLGAHYGAEAAGCTVIPMSGGQTEKQVQLIRDFAPDIIMVTPSYMLAILDEFRRQDIDPRSTQSGRPMGEGESGELVFTSLTKEALPVIRYRTGDLTRLLPGSIAAMRRVAKIVGRADDMLIIRGVNVFPSQIEELILRCQGLAPHYEIEITRPNRMDEMRILVEARPELAGHSHSAEASLLAGKVKDIVGISAEIFVVASGSLRRSSGKAVHVNDRR